MVIIRNNGAYFDHLKLLRPIKLRRHVSDQFDKFRKKKT